MRLYFCFLFALLFFFSWALRAFEPLANAEWRIKKYRTRLITLRLQEADGKPIKNRQVWIEMKRHQFLFGCSLFSFGAFPSELENQRYLELFSEVFNYATVPFYFRSSERQEGELESSRNYEMVKWCQENHILVKGHPLIWHLSAGNPRWLSDDRAQVEEALKERVQKVVREYSEIKYWDLLNEPTVAWRYNTPVAKWENELGPVQVFKKALSWAKSANPEGVYLVNDFNIDFDSNLGRFIDSPERIIKFVQDPVNHYPLSYRNYIKALIEEKAAPDAIGIQSHMHKGNWPLWELWQLVESYSRLKLPIHFTETTILSGEPRNKIDHQNPEKNLPWPSTPEGEQQQAEYLEKYYTLLFSHPAVEAISWWNLSDYKAWLNAPAGLVRKDLSLKPAYKRLKRLVRKEWWTNLEGQTNEKGEIRFRGFCGDYELVLLETREHFSFQVDCHKEEDQRIDLRFSEKF